MSILSSLFTFAKQLFEKKWDGAGSFAAMLKMPDKRQHHLYAYGLAVIILGLQWVSYTQNLFHPLALGVFSIGTFFLLMDEFGQFLHNQALIAAGQTPDRGISIWDVLAGWLAVLIVSVVVEFYFNKFAILDKIAVIADGLQ